MRNDGLTEQEGKVMDALVEAWNEFVKLPIQHPSDNTDFCNGIHQCQHILCMRILQRDYPEGYPIKSDKAKPSHKCIGCGHTVGERKPWAKDGLRCPMCGDSLVPIGSLTS